MQTPKGLGDDKTVTSSSGGSGGSGGGKSIKDSNANPHENATPPPDRSVCGDPIDVATGWMLLTQTDLEIPGALPLEVSRTHISSYRAGRYFGPSWASTVDQRLEVEDDGLHVALADGSLQSYPVPMSSPVLPVAGPARPLRRVEGGYLVEDPEQQHTLFFEESADGVFPLRTIFDGDGNRIDVVDGVNGGPAELVHSSGARVLFSGEDVATFAYDKAGRMISARNADAEVTFAYDALGRVVAETVDGRVVRSEYDELGRRRARHTPSGAASRFEYGPAGTLAALHVGNRSLRFEHDLAGHERVRRFGAAELRQSWAPGDRLVAQTVVSGNRTTQHREYGYLADGYLASVTDAITGPRTLEVDRSGRVRAVVGHGWQENHAYHRTGVIAQAQTPGAPTTGPREYRGTLLIAAGAVRYAHDPEGRTTLRGAGPAGPQWQFRWNAESRLTSVLTPNGEHWRYRYDALGRRVAKQRLTPDGRVAEQVQFARDGDTLAEQVRTGPGQPQVATVWEWEPGTGRALTQTERVLGTPDERFHTIVTDLDSWGWPVPFFVAAPLAAVGLYVRQRLEDTSVFEELAKSDAPRARLKDALRRDQAKAIFVTFGFSWICGVGLYFLGTYVVNYLTATAHVGGTRATVLTSIGLAVYCGLCPLAGRLSDRLGRRRTLLFGCLGHVVFGIPVFVALGTGSTPVVIVALIVFAIFQAPINANTSLVLIEMFPASTRLTSGALGFNLGVGAPSGFAPLVAAALVVSTGLSYAPGILLVGVALVCGLILLFWLPETAGRDLTLDVDATKRGPAPTIARKVTELVVP
ncbi:MFS transporter [Amycolatopsis sp. NPDC023774]|uniref:MFS transporter n=1 Tax=Amycolatopsis sp. NPDC023774 TaxID=3155015 RepID=UPI0033DD7D30